MRPELRLPTKRTESIGSRVPPAVTSTFSPSQGRPPAGTTASTAASSSAGSARRPIPHSCLEPSAPVPGSTTITPRSRRSARLACVAACSYMWLFIAGATSTGQVAASAAEVSRLSARPWASLAIVFARRRRDQEGVGVADQLEVAERVVLRRRLVGERAARGVALELVGEDRRPGEGGERRRARRSAGPSGVWMTRTACPALVARRTTSSAL